MRILIVVAVVVAVLAGCAGSSVASVPASRLAPTAAASAPLTAAPTTSASPSPSPSPSPLGPGGWLAQNDQIVAFLLLTGSDQALTGTLTGSYVPYAHQVDSFVLSVAGSVASDGTVALDFNPPLPFAAGDVPATGRIEGDLMDLTYADPTAALVTLAFARSDAAGYNTALNAFRNQQYAAAASAYAAESAAVAAADLGSCARGVAGHDAVAYVYHPGFDTAAPCDELGTFSIQDAAWDLPIQPAPPETNQEVCRGHLDGALVVVRDTGGMEFGNLICQQLPALPYFGIDPDATWAGYGVRVSLDGVNPGSPAAAAGLRERDVIVAFDGRPIATLQDLWIVLANLNPGDQVTVSLLRGDTTVNVRAILAIRPPA